MKTFFENISQFDFARPQFFYLLLLLPLLIAWYIYQHRRSQPTLQVSSTDPFETLSASFKQWFYHALFVFRLLALGLIIAALARPQSNFRRQDVSVEGIDIIIALDISGSMLAEDFKPNRIEAAKEVAVDFIGGRPTDRMGLVVFSGESFTQCPITTDHAVLINLFRDVKSGMITDGTALGDGLATAVNRLRESKAISKVVILLTDGVNNMGSVDPHTAAEMAKLFGIRIYTVGVGSLGQAPFPVQTPFGIRYQMVDVKIDDQLLQQMADLTDGKYFRATNNQKLKEIYAEIDQMEKSKIDITEYKRKIDEFRPLAFLALILLLTEVLLKFLVFRSVP
ncbi:MAG: VWA domain-containing protein [Bacteroidales bacterium]|nr:VWA domain-containing protein [Bacteroidales bacterium]MDZ4203690.1 VWA domain-containing protein [Bacteroidales bacterium]